MDPRNFAHFFVNEFSRLLSKIWVLRENFMFDTIWANVRSPRRDGNERPLTHARPRRPSPATNALVLSLLALIPSELRTYERAFP